MTLLSVLLAALMAAPFEAASVEPDTLPAMQDSTTVPEFTYAHGTVELENGVASLELPQSFKFLDAPQSAMVIVDIWGNPDADGVLGIIFPEADDPFTEGSYAYVVSYDESGHVDDGDADDIDYDEMLKGMQEGEAENNKLRAQAGYEPIHLVGWAAPPFYDDKNKVLHWDRELKFGDSALVNTLNYNVRVLGRKGVLVLNAVATMDDLELVKAHVPDVLGIVNFNDGHRYDQFDSSVDEVAAYGIGGLIAGKVLAKVGILALAGKFLLKFWYIIVVGIGGLWKWISGRKKKDTEVAPPTAYKP